MGLDQLNSPDISVLQFEDDIPVSLIPKNLDLNTCIRNIEIAAQRAYETIQHMGLQISTEKMKAIIFTKGEIRNIPNTIKISNAPIEWEVTPDYHLVLTDASVETANHTCGIDIYGEDLDISVSRKLTNYTSISSAVNLAIREAVKLSRNKTQKVAVISDSLSALQAITKQGVDKEQDYITLSTRGEIVKALQKGDVKLIWVPSHTGITGNVHADKLALAGRNQNLVYNVHADKLALAGRNQNLVYQNNLVPGRSFRGLIKDKLWNQWTANYKNGYQKKGQHNMDTQPTPSRIPWFYNIRYSNRAMISLIIRMRTNHCCTPTHLHKIGGRKIT
nr:unnamed protein product [Callosobruchus analis]